MQIQTFAYFFFSIRDLRLKPESWNVVPEAGLPKR